MQEVQGTRTKITDDFVPVGTDSTSGKNYNIGMKGEKYPGHFTDRPEGVWEGQNEINIFPRSLYIAQLMARQKKEILCILIK
ncbi:hypothetical protein [Parabacteroides gordonii]|jgi:hypothetical protein|uniref:hypothetical protein n=1 Tax=Parabacteroides gordonii TaxID=574930 RepID=UPI000ED99994|nr:hypothetical protein [Parabacteroides gordonii]RGP15119.1 hypothetical protein DXB27_14590 [Parabacteroides gordonii]